MHSSNNAACKCTSLQPSSYASQLSFPPTQSSGLLDSTTSGPGSNGTRSPDQRENLQRSFEGLLDSLNMSSEKKAA